ncbi:ThuA domain-containing protein [Streptacidiphilus sp. P02-A3a]|uniref:ThuA domain-containing protein n=1 Tax=Streptacidiphilus sp. P02-A3a TaxID=2704468 RepID=UPI0015F7AC48|nr:ThuA domain-containing protein [Streptacidiphilus sp. P02-A3a]QMU71385.1 ThuA domain-containing protein [Streptacidiphilus sp. P02-A3a]
MSPDRTALVVRGGWDGHAPVACTELFLPALAGAGFEVTVAEDLEVYRDQELLARTDLIVQCWSQGRLTGPQSEGLVNAVRAGTGFAGWHGGVVGTFTDDTDYLRMVGGLFLHHPEQHLDYRVRIAPAHRDHPVVAGLDDFAVHTELYWMLTDAHNTVLATTTVHPSGPPGPEPGAGTGPEPVEMPVVWTRRWGRGRVFFSAIGHQPEDLTPPVVRTLTARGLLWAAR